MTATTFLLKGKYSGLQYKDILNKDLNYCLFINELKYPSAEMLDFKNYLNSTSVNDENFTVLSHAVSLKVKREQARINKLHTQ